MLILLMFAVDCVLCRTVSHFLFYFLVCFGNCVLTWCRVSINLCDSSRGDLAGAGDNIKIEGLTS